MTDADRQRIFSRAGDITLNLCLCVLFLVGAGSVANTVHINRLPPRVDGVLLRSTRSQSSNTSTLSVSPGSAHWRSAHQPRGSAHRPPWFFRSACRRWVGSE